MNDENCPRCSQALAILQSSGRKVCRSCGWVSKSTQINPPPNFMNVVQESSIATPSEQNSHQPKEFETNQFKYCPSCGKFLPSQKLEAGYQVCTSCGWTNNGTTSSNDPKPHFTIPVRKDFSKGEKAGQNLAGGCAMSILLIFGGCIFLLIPIIGWMIGGFMIYAGIMSPVLGGGMALGEALGLKGDFSHDYELIGDCPYCTSPVKVSMSKKNDKNITVKCETCQEKILIKKDIFYGIVKRFSA